MAGGSDDGRNLDFVECFTIGRSEWKYLPSLNDFKSQEIADVLPTKRKYYA